MIIISNLQAFRHILIASNEADVVHKPENDENYLPQGDISTCDTDSTS